MRACRSRLVSHATHALSNKHPTLLHRLQAFDTAAALALLGYQPPPPPPPPPPPAAAATKRARAAAEASAAAAAAQAAAERPDLLAVLQRRSINAFRYLTPKDTANAVFVFSRVGAPGDVSAEWLQGYAEVG